MRIVAISDLHGHLPDIPYCDICLLCGDICPVWDHSLPFQALWLNTDFRYWLEKIPAKHIIATWGNHDFIAEQSPEKIPKDLGVEFLINQKTIYNGINIYATPNIPNLYGWAFYSTDVHLQQLHEQIPLDTNILISHGPPYSIGDSSQYKQIDDEENFPTSTHYGSKSLLERIKQLDDLKLCVFGHIHGGFGKYILKGQENKILANVSILDEAYNMSHPVTVFDY